MHDLWRITRLFKNVALMTWYTVVVVAGLATLGSVAAVLQQLSPHEIAHLIKIEAADIQNRVEPGVLHTPPDPPPEGSVTAFERSRAP